MPYPVAKLKEQFNIGKQAEINRRKALNISPYKDENGVFVITDDDYKTLQLLDSFLKKNPTAKITDFEINATESSGSSLVESSQSTGLETIKMNAEIETRQLDFFDEIELLGDRIASKLKPHSKDEALLWYGENKILISSAQVKELIGVSPKGQEFVRGSFKFIKSGKIGNQSAWRVKII